MIVIVENNIIAQIIRSLDYGTVYHADLIDKHVPWYLKKAVSDFAEIKDTVVYNLFNSGKFVYYSFLVRKMTAWT